MIDNWKEFSVWARDKGSYADEDEIIIIINDVKFCFWNDGEIWVKKRELGCEVRITIAKEKTTENMKHFILALIEER